MSNVEVVIEGVGKVRLPDGCQWIARDHNGSWWAYKKQPEANVTEGYWDAPGVDVAHLLTDADTVVPDWLETLRRVGADEVCPGCNGNGQTPEAGVAFGAPVICPDCAGSGHVEDSITASKGNTPIGELLAQYEEEGCDHSNMEWVRAAAQRYVETMEDSQVRCLLHVLSAPKPESAEAVGEVLRSGNGVARVAMFNDSLRPGTKVYTAPPRPEASKWERIIGNWQERVAAAGFNGVEEAIEAIEASIAPQQASAPVGVDANELAGVRARLKSGDYDGADVMRAWLAIDKLLTQQPAAEVYVDFPQVGTAGPLAVVDGKVTLPDTTMNDLIRHARTGYVEQPAAVDEATRRDAERYRYLRRPEAWKENHISERGASAIFIGDGRRAEAKDGEALDAAIDRILAGQQP